MEEILRAYDNLSEDLGVDLSGKCTAITLSNERCKIKAIRGSPFCGRHQPDEETEKAAREKAKKLKEADKKYCEVFIQVGHQCKKLVVEGQVRCHIHMKERKKKPIKDLTNCTSSDYEIISPLYNFEDLGNSVTYYDQKYCRPIGDESTLLIKSRAGSGKTKAIIEHFKRHIDKRCAYVVPIQALAKSIRKELPDFHNYLDEKNNICYYDKVIISFFSLFKMDRTPFDILIIDESEELCGMIFSSIMIQQPNWKLIANAFAWHVQHASQVICLDAALSKRSLKLIEQIRCRDRDVNSLASGIPIIRISVNQNIPDPRIVIPILYRKQLYIVSTIMRIVTYHVNRYKQGFDRDKPPPKFAFTSASAELAIFVYKAAQSQNVKTIIHVADQKNHQYLENVNKS